ncbi:MAG: type I glyceraldehyde-3-phosphate dehydrogenase [Candidatus Altiarchaeales archaeon IMC4]|nr:MAG: type I glyceraldehyde-3-phosphate dehydrogenase [Candidatus Altiarchaeales archaeon IMC4]
MAINVAINGFGRIGRCVFRAAQDNKKINVVAVNDLTDPKTLAHLLKYDSVHGQFGGNVAAGEKSIVVNGKEIAVYAERDPENLPWKSIGVDVAIESTGFFTKRDGAQKHIKAGAKKVIISAPATDPDVTIVMGVNEKTYDQKKHSIISNASCTTNCLAPVAKVLVDNFGIERGLMTTIHAYTGDQRLLDAPHSDLRRARSAALSMIPTSTGAAKAIGLVIPELNGKMDGIAIRVPTPNVSIVDLAVELKKDATADDINRVLKTASESKMKGILGYTDEPLVSVDFNHSPLSSIVDGKLTKALGGKFAKVFSWYDNEWGYSNRMVDLAQYVMK